MKKLFITGLMALAALSTVANAEVKLSGNVTTGVGYQHDDENSANAPLTGGLTQGDLGFTSGAERDHFGFWVDQVELDVENEFGENIMARADVDFTDLTGGAGSSAVLLEQGYVTANLAAGNGAQLLVGKFNSPLGLESVDRHSNVFSTYTPTYVKLMPKQMMGAKVWYAFNDTWNMDIGLVNSLNNADTNDNNSAYPSGFLRVGAAWGDEGRESTFNIGGGFGPEHNVAQTGTEQNAHFDYMVTAWGNWALGDAWDLGWEGAWRQTEAVASGVDAQMAWAAQLYAKYMVSDAWTVQARGAIIGDMDNTLGGASTTGATWNGLGKGYAYSGTLGATYAIADGANVKWEYRFDMGDPDATGLDSAIYHTAVAEFGYSF